MSPHHRQQAPVYRREHSGCGDDGVVDDWRAYEVGVRMRRDDGVVDEWRPPLGAPAVGGRIDGGADVVPRVDRRHHGHGNPRPPPPPPPPPYRRPILARHDGGGDGAGGGHRGQRSGTSQHSQHALRRGSTTGSSNVGDVRSDVVTEALTAYDAVLARAKRHPSHSDAVTEAVAAYEAVLARAKRHSSHGDVCDGSARQRRHPSSPRRPAPPPPKTCARGKGSTRRVAASHGGAMRANPPPPPPRRPQSRNSVGPPACQMYRSCGTASPAPSLGAGTVRSEGPAAPPMQRSVSRERAESRGRDGRRSATPTFNFKLQLARSPRPSGAASPAVVYDSQANHDIANARTVTFLPQAKEETHRITNTGSATIVTKSRSPSLEEEQKDASHAPASRQMPAQRSRSCGRASSRGRQGLKGERPPTSPTKLQLARSHSNATDPIKNDKLSVAMIRESLANRDFATISSAIFSAGNSASPREVGGGEGDEASQHKQRPTTPVPSSRRDYDDQRSATPPSKLPSQPSQSASNPLNNDELSPAMIPDSLASRNFANMSSASRQEGGGGGHGGEARQQRQRATTPVGRSQSRNRASSRGRRDEASQHKQKPTTHVPSSRRDYNVQRSATPPSELSSQSVANPVNNDELSPAMIHDSLTNRDLATMSSASRQEGGGGHGGEARDQRQRAATPVGRSRSRRRASSRGRPGRGNERLSAPPKVAGPPSPPSSTVYPLEGPNDPGEISDPHLVDPFRGDAQSSGAVVVAGSSSQSDIHSAATTEISNTTNDRARPRSRSADRSKAVCGALYDYLDDLDNELFEYLDEFDANNIRARHRRNVLASRRAVAASGVKLSKQSGATPGAGGDGNNRSKSGSKGKNNNNNSSSSNDNNNTRQTSESGNSAGVATNRYSPQQTLPASSSGNNNNNDEDVLEGRHSGYLPHSLTRKAPSRDSTKARSRSSSKKDNAAAVSTATHSHQQSLPSSNNNNNSNKTEGMSSVYLSNENGNAAATSSNTKVGTKKKHGSKEITAAVDDVRRTESIMNKGNKPKTNERVTASSFHTTSSSYDKEVKTYSHSFHSASSKEVVSEAVDSSRLSRFLTRTSSSNNSDETQSHLFSAVYNAAARSNIEVSPTRKESNKRIATVAVAARRGRRGGRSFSPERRSTTRDRSEALNSSLADAKQWAKEDPAVVGILKRQPFKRNSAARTATPSTASVSTKSSRSSGDTLPMPNSPVVSLGAGDSPTQNWCEMNLWEPADDERPRSRARSRSVSRSRRRASSRLAAREWAASAAAPPPLGDVIPFPSLSDGASLRPSPAASRHAIVESMKPRMVKRNSFEL